MPAVEVDVETMKRVVERRAINDLEQPVAKLAKAFPVAILTGSQARRAGQGVCSRTRAFFANLRIARFLQVGLAHTHEAASHGVNAPHAAFAGPGGLCTLHDGARARARDEDGDGDEDGVEDEDRVGDDGEGLGLM